MDTWKDRFPLWAIGLVVIVGFLAACVGMFFLPAIAAENRDLTMVLFTALVSFAGTVCNFFFGSSSGSQKKDAALAAASAAPTTPATPKEPTT